MRTAFGILLFMLAYGPVAFLIYRELRGQRPRVQPRLAWTARRRRSARLQAAGQYQR